MSDPYTADARAALAATSIETLFGRRLAGIPGTHIAAVQWPASFASFIKGPWHYWWQAHYLECLAAAGARELREGLHPEGARLGRELLAGIRWRNLARFPNHYYDDMAWLALAAESLKTVLDRCDMDEGRCTDALHALIPKLESAHTDDFGGGIFWNTTRDFKNTPATAPTALVFARTGDRGRARELLDWLQANLLDRETGLYLDGLRKKKGEIVIERAVFTYNQGPVIGAHLTLGEPEDLRAVEDLVPAIAKHLTRDVNGRPVLQTHGSGDGGLFTGILAHYLGQPAVDARLPESTRAAARELVDDYANALWSGRRPAGNGHDDVVVFSTDPAVGADVGTPEGKPVELSPQLSAWLAFEAAAVASAGTDRIEQEA